MMGTGFKSFEARGLVRFKAFNTESLDHPKLKKPSIKHYDTIDLTYEGILNVIHCFILDYRFEVRDSQPSVP